MLLKFRKRDVNVAEGPAELSAKLGRAENRAGFFSLSTRTLLQVISEFTLELREIDSDDFKNELSEMAESLATLGQVAKLQRIFERGKKRLLAFARRQKEYLLAREKEFKDIIDILTKAFVTLDGDNADYNREILRRSEKMEQITLLDDIKKIKQALINEIGQLRETVHLKEGRDGTRLESLARQVDILNSELRKVQRESERDGLTGAHNRRAFDRRIAGLVQQNTVTKAAFSLLLLDLDDFKKINDTFGHQTGDRVLVAVVNKCRRFIRSEDILARYGGEEFAIILPGASLKNARKKARQICEAVAGTRYAVEDDPQQRSLGVTVSVGVSAFRKSDSVKAVIERADEALYAAKRGGKNRVVSEKELPKDLHPQGEPG